MRYPVPIAVQQTATRALALRRQYGRGGTDVGMGTARRLARGGAVPFEFVKKVSEYFPRHAGDRLDDPTSNGSIAWGLWGGDAGRRWSEGVMAKAKKTSNPEFVFEGAPGYTYGEKWNLRHIGVENPGKVVISQLVKRIASAGKFDGSEFKGKQVDPRVVEKQWKRQAVIHGVAEYGAPVQKLLRDEYESAFWQGAARGLASMANPKPKVTDRALRYRANATGRRNPAPDIKTSAAIKRALAKLTEEQRYEVVRHSDRMFHAMLDEGFDSKKAAELAEVAALNKAHALSLVRRNPEEPAAELYEKFHGKPSERVDVIEEEVHYHEHLAGLGQLIELKVKTPTKIRATLRFGEGPEAPILSSSEDGRQLYIVGGDQKLDLQAIEMDGSEWRRDLMEIGEILEVTYLTEKKFHRFEPCNYFHRLGEETGVKPTLLYDTRNERMMIAGGQYHVKPEGIVN